MNEFMNKCLIDGWMKGSMDRVGKNPFFFFFKPNPSGVFFWGGGLVFLRGFI